nr:CPBP family glutamic-type intramembrane protease [Phytoactinopolyspora mesophila]
MFGLMHGLRLDGGVTVDVDLTAILASVLAGVLLVWVRVRGGSLQPAVVLHNGINSSTLAVGAMG